MMACACKRDIECRLLERFKEQAPEASCHEVKLNGYAFIFGETVTLKGCMPIEATAVYPLKKGGSKQKTQKQSLMFTYCPFCGVKYDSKKDSEGTLP